MTGSRQSRIRVPTTEYIGSKEVLATLVGSGMTNAEATATLSRNSARLRRSLKLEKGRGPIEIDGETVTVVKVAGVVRLSPGVELDIAPKFLGDKYHEWRQDLLAISNYTQRGSISPDHVRARRGTTGDLASVIGRAFVDEFWKHYRKPLRIYRQQRWRDFSLDGELDFDELHERSADGLPQRAVVLDRRNPYNALLARAAEVLVSDARDATIRTQLLRVRSLLGAQDPPARSLRPVPARHEPWADLVELAKQIVAGGDLTLHADRYEAPGFVVRTEKAWERLTFLALRHHFGVSAVFAEKPFDWGAREDDAIRVWPDVTIESPSDGRRLVDAKYKTRIDRRSERIEQTDLMEASAFMAAADVDRIVLVYPRSALDGPPAPCGQAHIFDVATLVPGRTVLGVAVEVRGFSQQHEHRRFAERLGAAIDKAFAVDVPAVGLELT